MVRLRPSKAVRVLTFEEKKRVANLFILLVEVDLQKGVTRTRRTPTIKTVGCKKRNTQPEEKIEITPLFFM